MIARFTHQSKEESLQFYGISISVYLIVWINKRRFRLRLFHLLSDSSGNLRCGVSIGRPNLFLLSLLWTETLVIPFEVFKSDFSITTIIYYSCSDLQYLYADCRQINQWLNVKLGRNVKLRRAMFCQYPRVASVNKEYIKITGLRTQFCFYFF